jgi:hypothetical protein
MSIVSRSKHRLWLWYSPDTSNDWHAALAIYGAVLNYDFALIFLDFLDVYIQSIILRYLYLFKLVYFV